MKKEKFKTNKTTTQLSKLLNKEITPSECITNLNLKSDCELLMLLAKIDQSKRISKLSNIKEMNYLDIKKYIQIQIEKGANPKDIIKEVEIQWENGTLKGFDYRYFVESAGYRLSKEFINHSKSIGRYDD